MNVVQPITAVNDSLNYRKLLQIITKKNFKLIRSFKIVEWTS
jgi:hypothetical protein